MTVQSHEKTIIPLYPHFSSRATAPHLHAEIEALRERLAEVNDQRDAWQAEAERLQGSAFGRG